MTKATLKDRIAKLRDTFIARLPAQMEQIEAIYQRLLAGREMPTDPEELHRLFHGLKGSSASFGMTELNPAAKCAEEEARQILQQGNPGPAQLERELGRLIAALYHIVHGNDDRSEPMSSGYELLEEPANRRKGPPLVYLCDDDPVQAEHLATQISCFGYRIDTFINTSVLIEAIYRQRPAAIILDIVFPDNPDEGLHTLTIIQERNSPEIPTILLSGRTDFAARLRAVQAGSAAYYVKPVKVQDLVDTLDHLTSTVQPAPFRILVVDDEPEISQYHALILEDAGMDTLVVNRPEEIIERISQFNPDLVLMDMYMPACNGKDLALVIRQIPAFVSLPIVYLSSETDEARQFSALRAGADGFLTKPIEPDRLIADVTVRAERMRTLRGLMLRDSLTGLYNHTTIMQMLSSASEAAARNNRTLSFAMIDIDHFKSVNDRYGHPVGDQVLLALARILQQRLRKSDAVGRYGGEEFSLVLPDTNDEQARRIVDSLREGFATVRFFTDTESFSCTFSAGISTFPDLPGNLGAAADQALYQAKKAGRNRVVCTGEVCH